MIKRYSFPSEAKAKELILKLAPEKFEGTFNQLTTTEKTHAIVCLGFQDKYSFDIDTKESVLVSKGLTYDVDVMWKDSPSYGWSAYEVNVKTPNHNFA